MTDEEVVRDWIKRMRISHLRHGTAEAMERILDRAQPLAWRCFHCDETFTDRRCAAAHFGADEDAAPACQIKQGGEGTMLEALRRAEKAAGDATFAMLNESTDAAQAYYSQQGRHAEQLTAAEQIGYERGLADASANPETLGMAATSLRESAK